MAIQVGVGVAVAFAVAVAGIARQHEFCAPVVHSLIRNLK